MDWWDQYTKNTYLVSSGIQIYSQETTVSSILSPTKAPFVLSHLGHKNCLQPLLSTGFAELTESFLSQLLAAELEVPMEAMA